MKLIYRLLKKIATAAAVIWLATAATAEPTVQKELPGPNTLRIHYQRQDASYQDYGLWLWDEVKQPSTDWPGGAMPFSGHDEFGVYADVELLDNATQIGFLILNTKTGEKENGSKIVVLNGQKEVWAKEADDNVYDSPELQLKLYLKLATVTSSGKLQLLFNARPQLSATELQKQISLKNRHNKALTVNNVEMNENNSVTVSADFDAETAPLVVTFADKSLSAGLDWRLIDELYACNDVELGCIFANGRATINLWAPLAEKVDFMLFDKNDQTKLIWQNPMQRQKRGIWQIILAADTIAGAENLDGCFYQFEVTNPGSGPKKVLDPYARSMAAVTVDSAGQSAGSSGDLVGKAAIVAPQKHGPKLSGHRIAGVDRREDAIIYEVHIRDFTADPAIEKELNHRWGSYRAFIDKLPYIKELGVTHIQLLPVMAWYYGDETAMGQRELEYCAKNNHYNWGYDPQNYFSPDGAYSENPNDPKARIAELKELIDAVHKAGMGVVLDVVYTHMAKAAFLNDIVPDYYFFRNAEGTFLGDFGNNLATNRKMAARLLIDSVKYWFSEYKIDGMRFDMMGDATQDAIQAAFDAAVAINPQTIFIGEGWRTFKGHIEDSALHGKGADQDWMNKTDSVGVFSDEFRNELKSGFGCEGEPMFLTGGKRDIKKLFKAIIAQPGNTPADAPGDMVQYIEAHDNMPLYDVIAQSIKKDPEIPANDAEIHRRIRIGNAMVLTAQGTAFLHAGQEYGRSKQWLASSTPEQKFHFLSDADGKPFKHPYFIHDSYDSSDAINKFDWAKVSDAGKFPTNMATCEFTRGLIKLRRSTDAFRLPSKELIDKNTSLIEVEEIAPVDLAMAYSCKATNGNRFCVFINADNKTRTFTTNLDLAKGKILVDGRQAGCKSIELPVDCQIRGNAITLEPLTVAIIQIPD